MYNVHIYKGIYSFSCETGLFLLDKCQITLAMKQNQNHFMYQLKKKRKWTQLLRENNIRRRMNKVHLIYNYWVSGLFIPVFVKNRSEIQDPVSPLRSLQFLKLWQYGHSWEQSFGQMSHMSFETYPKLLTYTLSQLAGETHVQGTCK